MSKIINNLLCTAMVFLLTFAWAVYCLRDVRLSALLAAVVALASAYIIFAVLSKLEKKKKTRKIHKKTLESFATFLQFNSDNSALFLPMLCYYNFTAEVLDFDNIILTKDCRTLAYFAFETVTVLPENVRRAIVCAKRNGCEKLLVFCNKFDSSVKAVATAQFPTEFVDINNTYALFERAEMLPQLAQVKTKKTSFLPQFAFNKKRFLWYFFAALYMLFLSAISFVKIYLLICASVNFLLALYSLFNRRFNVPSTDLTLD